MSCTGFCAACLHLGLTGVYCSPDGQSSEVIGAKGRRFIIKSLQEITKAIRVDGVAAGSTTSAL
jgi:hypothetical protein